jgi:hypothetical protein
MEKPCISGCSFQSNWSLNFFVCFNFKLHYIRNTITKQFTYSQPPSVCVFFFLQLCVQIKSVNIWLLNFCFERRIYLNAETVWDKILRNRFQDFVSKQPLDCFICRGLCEMCRQWSLYTNFSVRNAALFIANEFIITFESYNISWRVIQLPISLWF